MRSILNGLLIALSMYSKIPVPQAEWERAQYALRVLLFSARRRIDRRDRLRSVLSFRLSRLSAPARCGVRHCRRASLRAATIWTDSATRWTPFLPVSRAKGNWKILKDSHAGAFAIIWCVVYFIAYFAAAGTLTLQTYAVFALAYPFERALSALSIMNFRSAKEGLASTFKNSGSRAAVSVVCALWLVAAAAGCILLSPVLGAIVVGCGIAAYFLCIAVIFNTFGGMSATSRAGFCKSSNWSCFSPPR